MASHANTLHVDSTYKITFQGYPLIIVGTTDFNKRFHLIGMQLSTSETQRDFEFMFQALKEGTRLVGNIIKVKAVVSIQ